MVTGQLIEEDGDVDDTVGVWRWVVETDVVGGCGPAPGLAAQFFEADVSGDAERPCLDGSSLPAVKVADDPGERFLGGVVGQFTSGEMGAESPHVALELPEELLKGTAITVARGNRQLVELHALSMAARQRNFQGAPRHQ